MNPEPASGRIAPAGQAIISVRNLTVRYGSLPPAISDLSLDVTRGECVLLTGRSGCGKSTLARALTGLIPHAIPAEMTGMVTIEGVDTRQSSIPDLAEKIGIVFQNPASQLFHLTVAEEVSFGPFNLGLQGREIVERTDWALDAVGLSAMRGKRPSELSGGQQQRLAIASMLAMRPSILALDEPTASLDPAGARDVMRTLSEMRNRFGLTLILIEHRLTYAAPLAERTIVMDDGRIAADDRTDILLADAARLTRYSLRSPAGADDEMRLPITPFTPPAGEPLVSLKGVSAGYGRQPVLEQIDLELHPGEFTALNGDNGSGKTTLSLVLAGLLKPMKGSVISGSRRPRPGEDVTLLFQNPSDQLFCDTVDEEVAYGPRNFSTYDASEHAALMKRTDLTGLSARMPASLSVGQQQRTTLAACLALRSKVLILDEPTLGQDWGHLQEIMEFISELNRAGQAILIITHDMDLVRRYARRLIRLEHGRITEDGTIS